MRYLTGRSSITAYAALALCILFAVALAAAQDLPTSNVVPAERLKLKYMDGQFLLLNRFPIRKVLPPTQGLPDSGRELSGFWYELQDLNGTVRYRRIMENPVLLVFEGPDPANPDSGAPERKEGMPLERVFSLLIPSPQVGDQLVLFGGPLMPDAQAGPVKELARIPILPVIG